MVPYTVNLSPTTPVNTLILNVTARDPDAGNNGLVEYSLQTNSGPSEIMQVHTVSYYLGGEVN